MLKSLLRLTNPALLCAPNEAFKAVCAGLQAGAAWRDCGRQ